MQPDCMSCSKNISDVESVALTHLLLSHLGELVQEGEVLGQVFAVGLDAVLHDGQERLHEARDAGSAADILHRTVHVVGAATWERRQTVADGCFLA